MPSIEMLRRFAGAAPDADTLVLGYCLQAAAIWYERAGVPAREDDDLYDFWVCNLAAWMYDNRGATGPEANVPPYIVVSVHQLRRRQTAAAESATPQAGEGAGET